MSLESLTGGLLHGLHGTAGWPEYSAVRQWSTQVFADMEIWGYKVGLRANTKTLRQCTVYIYTHMKHARQHFVTFLSSTLCSDAKWLLCASLLFVSGTSEQMLLNTTQQHGNRQRKCLGGSLQFTVVMYPPIHAA